MYKIDESTASEGGSGGKFFGVGIQEDVKIKDILIAETKAGDDYLRIEFEGAEGQEIAHTEFAVDRDRLADDAAFEKKINNQIKRIKHILTKFMDESDVIINAKSFEDFAKKIVKLAKGNYDGKTFRLKLIYSYNDYVSVPAYVPFLESMDVDSAKSDLRITDFDKMEKDSADSSEDLINVDDGSDDLPFD